MTKKFIIAYNIGDAEFTTRIESGSWEEAERRLKAIAATGRVLGEWVQDVPEKAEPVAWAHQWKKGKDRSWTVTTARWPESDEWHEYPLYTTPQPAAWVGLTSQDMRKIVRNAPEPLNPNDIGNWVVNVIKATESICREKNGGVV